MVLNLSPKESLQNGFRPLTGMVRRLQSSKVTSFRFRPLTGMVHDHEEPVEYEEGFRPLTGMVPHRVFRMQLH